MHGGAFCTRDTHSQGHENQRQGETEEENGDNDGDKNDNECRRCSDFLNENLSKHRDDQKNVVIFYATEVVN
jgi:hypothetical protein